MIARIYRWGLLHLTSHTFNLVAVEWIYNIMCDMESATERKRFHVFLSAVVGWGFCFLCQRTLPSAIGYMTTSETGREDGQYSDSKSGPVFSKEEYGQLQNLFVIAYSSSILLGGFLSDILTQRISSF